MFCSVLFCVLSAHLRDDESSTCVCLRLREQCLRSEITLSRPQVDLTFERFRFLAPCQRLHAIICVLSAHLRRVLKSTCVCLRFREQCLRSEITSVSRVAHVPLLRFVAGNTDVNTPAFKRSQLIGNTAIVRKRCVIHTNSTCVCWRLSVATFTQKRKDASFDLWPPLVSRVAHVLLLRFVAGNMDVNTPASKRSQLIGNTAIVRKRCVIHKKSTCVCLRLSVAAFTRKRRDASFDLWPALDVLEFNSICVLCKLYHFIRKEQ